MSRFSKNSLRVYYAFAVYGAEERKRVLRVLDEHRILSAGRETPEFERRVARVNHDVLFVIEHLFKKGLMLFLPDSLFLWRACRL